MPCQLGGVCYSEHLAARYVFSACSWQNVFVKAVFNEAYPSNLEAVLLALLIHTLKLSLARTQLVTVDIPSPNDSSLQDMIQRTVSIMTSLFLRPKSVLFHSWLTTNKKDADAADGDVSVCAMQQVISLLESS